LLELARRPAHRAAADEATVKLVSSNDASPAALSLRVALLETQNRRDELGALLAAKVESASSLELLERIGIADRDGFPAVRVRAFERRITLLSDPVERMRLRLALMRFHEGRGDLASAQKVMEALYSENPTVLGVVRAAADFYWRNKMQPRAIEVLRRAAAASNPGLKKQFTFEAARKSTESGEVVAARQLLQPLLQGDPFNAGISPPWPIPALRLGRRGLRDFYLAAISPCATPARRCGTLRRRRRFAADSSPPHPSERSARPLDVHRDPQALSRGRIALGRGGALRRAPGPQGTIARVFHQGRCRFPQGLPLAHGARPPPDQLRGLPRGHRGLQRGHTDPPRPHGPARATLEARCASTRRS
jgi:hypothetical protein